MRSAIGFNAKQSGGFNFYHPVASVIMSIFEKKITFITRGLYEVRNLQAENFVAEKFAITTYSRLAEGFARDFITLQTDCNLIITPNESIMEEKAKIYESKQEAKYRLIFNPLDSLTNFARGFNECGCSFTLQSIIPMGKKTTEDIFTLFFNFKTQKFLYSEYKGITYLENKRMKALNRKASLVVSINTEGLKESATLAKLQEIKLKQLICRESFIADLMDIASGSLDGIIYKNISVYNAIPISIVCNSLALFTNGFESSLYQKDLNEKITLVAGSETLCKYC